MGVVQRGLVQQRNGALEHILLTHDASSRVSAPGQNEQDTAKRMDPFSLQFLTAEPTSFGGGVPVLGGDNPS